MEVDGIVTQSPALPHLLEFDALDLNAIEPLANDHVGAIVVVRAFRLEVLVHDVAGRDDPDAAREQSHSRACLRAVLDEIRVKAFPDAIRQPCCPLLLGVVGTPSIRVPFPTLDPS